MLSIVTMRGQEPLERLLVQEFEQFFRSSRQTTLLAILPLVRDTGEAEDVLQVAYERAARHWRTVRTYDSPAGWVRRVATNEAVSVLRRARRRIVDYLPDLHDMPGNGQAHVDAYAHDAPDLLMALRHLRRQDRVVLTLRYVLEFTVEEIAAELGAQPNTVKAQLARARTRLARLVGGDDGHPAAVRTGQAHGSVS